MRIMLYQPRTKSQELTTLELLSKRKNLTSQEKQLYLNLEKGYEGEKLFDRYMEELLQSDCLILNDLLLQVNNTTFQIDSLIIAQGKTYLYEVKNHEGDYYYQSDKFFKKPNFEVVNPLHQLSRCESLFRQLLLKNGFNPPTHASVVFINPNFTLYGAPLDKPIIFPTQIEWYVNNLKAKNYKVTDRDMKIANKLMELHQVDTPFSQLPHFEFEQLQKGIVCSECYSFSIVIEKSLYICKHCHHKETITNAILNAIRELQILFPDKKITTNLVYDWCKGIKSKKTISRMLNTHFKKVGEHRWTYYE